MAAHQKTGCFWDLDGVSPCSGGTLGQVLGQSSPYLLHGTSLV